MNALPLDYFHWLRSSGILDKGDYQNQEFEFRKNRMTRKEATIAFYAVATGISSF
jgi:hypothetical protein